MDGKVIDPARGASPAFDNLPQETRFAAKDFRELPGRCGATDQFKETAFAHPHVHKRSNTATYFLSVAKKLKTMSARSRADLYFTPVDGAEV